MYTAYYNVDVYVLAAFQGAITGACAVRTVAEADVTSRQILGAIFDGVKTKLWMGHFHFNTETREDADISYLVAM